MEYKLTKEDIKEVNRRTKEILVAMGLMDKSFLEEGISCPMCHRLYTKEMDKTCIEEIGVCFACDHVEGETLQDLQMV